MSAENPRRAALMIANLSHAFGEAKVLEQINLSVDQGQIVCLVGTSGSGKSTLLRIIAGLIALQEGSVCFEGLAPAIPGQEPSTQDRQCGFVFQDHALFPHLSVLENVAFGLQHVPKGERLGTVERHLASVGLSNYQHRFPHTLSGGEQQRVAIARALAPEPKILLMDEPFLSVDVALRRRLREDTRRALRVSNKPAIIVTHDPQEALDLADRIAVLHEGRIVQNDTPEHVWDAPANLAVAKMFFDNDDIPGVFEAGLIHTSFGDFVWTGHQLRNGQTCSVIVRPESIQLKESEQGPIQLADKRFLGNRYLAVLESQNQRLRAISAEPIAFDIGAPLVAEIASEGYCVFPIDDNDSH